MKKNIIKDLIDTNYYHDVLLTAIKEKHYNMLEYLFNLGITVRYNEKLKIFETNDEQIYNLFIDFYPDMIKHDHEKFISKYPLSYCIKNNFVTSSKKILSIFNNLNNVENYIGEKQTFLQFIKKETDISIIGFLIDAGIDLKFTFKSGTSIIDYLLYSEGVDLQKIILEKKIHVSQTTYNIL